MAMPASAMVMLPSTKKSATEDTTPVMWEVYCPTAKKPPALVAPATNVRAAPRRMLFCAVRSRAVQP